MIGMLKVGGIDLISCLACVCQGPLFRYASLPSARRRWPEESPIGWHSFHFPKCHSVRLPEVSRCLRIDASRQILFVFSGLRRGISCVSNAFQARSYVREHRLQLDRAAHHGGVGVALPEEPKSGIPDGCGFELPILPLIFIVNLLSLIYWTRT